METITGSLVNGVSIKVSMSRGSRPPVGQNNKWRYMRFTLDLRTVRRTHCRFMNLRCEPLPPLGAVPDRISLCFSLEPGREEALLTGFGTTTRGTYAELRLSSMGSCRVYDRNSPPRASYRWTSILESLRGVLHKANGIMALNLVLEREDDLDMLQSFLTAAASDVRRDYTDHERRPYVDAAYYQVPISSISDLTPARPPDDLIPQAQSSEGGRPQTNPNLDPRIYDPYPGIPVPLAKGSCAPVLDLVPESPGETSQMFAALALSPDEGHVIGRDSDKMSDRSSSSAWSFLDESKKQGRLEESSVKSSSSASSSSSSPSPSLSPSPSPLPSPSRPLLASSPPPSPWRPLLASSPLPSLVPVRPRRGPVIVKSSSSSSDVEVLSVREIINEKSRRKKTRKSGLLGNEGDERMDLEPKQDKKKKRKKRRGAVEPGDSGGNIRSAGEENAREADVEADRRRRRRDKDKKRADSNGTGEGEFGAGDEVAKAERKSRRREKRRRKMREVDNDGDIDMQGDEKLSKRKEKRKLKTVGPPSDSEPAPPLAREKRKKKKDKGKERMQESGSEELPALPLKYHKSSESSRLSRNLGSTSASESRKSSKRKRHEYSTPEVDENASLEGGDGGGEDIGALKKRLLEINMAKYELIVEEKEINAKIHRASLTARKKMGPEGLHFENCTCTACGEYGHRKSSWLCKKHPKAADILERRR